MCNTINVIHINNMEDGQQMAFLAGIIIDVEDGPEYFQPIRFGLMGGHNSKTALLAETFGREKADVFKADFPHKLCRLQN